MNKSEKKEMKELKKKRKFEQNEVLKENKRRKEMEIFAERKKNEEEWEELRAIIEGGKVDALQIYMKENNEKYVKHRDRALCEVAENGNLTYVKKLIDSGADVNCKIIRDNSYYNGIDIEEVTPLALAAVKGHIECCEYLLDKNANPHLTTSSEESHSYHIGRIKFAGVTVLSTSIKYFSSTIEHVRNLSEKSQRLSDEENKLFKEFSNVDYEPEDKNNVESQKIIKNISLFLKYEADVNAADNNKNQPFLEYEADVNAADNNKNQSFIQLFDIITDHNNFIKSYKELDLNNKEQEIIHQNINKLILHVLTLLCQYKVDVNIRIKRWVDNSEQEIIPLYQMIKFGNYDIAKVLINNGAYHGIKDELGNTAAHLAAQGGNLDLIKDLRNADFNIKNLQGETPLEIAKKNSKTEIVDYISELLKPAIKPYF